MFESWILNHWPLWGGSTGDRWIPLIKGQQHGKCFHLVMTSCTILVQNTIFVVTLLSFHIISYNWHKIRYAKHFVPLCSKRSTQRAPDAIIRSLWCQNDVATSFWHHYNVIFASCVRWEGVSSNFIFFWKLTHIYVVTLLYYIYVLYFW